MIRNLHISNGNIGETNQFNATRRPGQRGGRDGQPARPGLRARPWC
ncbi:MAG: hypothetical protein U5R48_11925 [Gammaproteobacteria bacterium]|nr:hypothetical protein [Gammaproteobacteria bacterium]